MYSSALTFAADGPEAEATGGMSMLLGIDAGLTVTKAALYEIDGQQVAIGASRCPQQHPRPHQVERDMVAAWESCVAAVRSCLRLAGSRAAEIAAVGLVGHGDGLYLVDRQLQPVRPAILALDSRAEDLCASWRAGGLLSEVLATSGQEPPAVSQAALCAWLARHEPQALAGARWLLYCKDWLRLQLTGEVGTDVTDASASFTGFATRNYEPRLLEVLGLSDDLMDRLPRLHGSAEVVGAVTRQAAAVTGLPAGTPVVAGCHDVHAAAVGMGGIDFCQLSLIAGTFSINQVMTKTPTLDPRWQVRASVLDDRYLAMSTSPASATSLEWLIERVAPELIELASAQRRTSSEIALEEAAAVIDGPSRVFFQPFFYGSPTGKEAGAVLVGLRGWHSRGHVVRALLEGVVFNHRWHVDALRSGFAIQPSARLGGGAARSPLWSQLFADALRIPVEIVDTEETGARGAAVLAGTGIGVYASIPAGIANTVRVVRRHEPDSASARRLDEAYTTFTAITAGLPLLSGQD
jgi:L-xylulokinase